MLILSQRGGEAKKQNNFITQPPKGPRVVPQVTLRSESEGSIENRRRLKSILKVKAASAKLSQSLQARKPSFSTSAKD